jgi:hypothetical protein
LDEQVFAVNILQLRVLKRRWRMVSETVASPADFAIKSTEEKMQNGFRNRSKPSRSTCPHILNQKLQKSFWISVRLGVT